MSLILSTAVAITISPRRCRIIGTGRYVAAWMLIAGPALFGAICVRGGYTLALQERGLNGVLAQMIGLFAGLMFILLVRIALMLFPPSAWLLKEWRRANREASFLRRAFRPRVD